MLNIVRYLLSEKKKKRKDRNEIIYLITSDSIPEKKKKNSFCMVIQTEAHATTYINMEICPASADQWLSL